MELRANEKQTAMRRALFGRVFCFASVLLLLVGPPTKSLSALETTFDNLRGVYLGPSALRSNPSASFSNLNIGFGSDLWGNGTEFLKRYRFDLAFLLFEFLQVGAGTSQVLSNTAYGGEIPEGNAYNYSRQHLSMAFVANEAITFGFGFLSQSSELTNFQGINQVNEDTLVPQAEDEFLDVVYSIRYQNQGMNLSLNISGFAPFLEDEDEENPFENIANYEFMDTDVFSNRTIVVSYHEITQNEFTNIIEGKYIVRDNIINYHVTLAFGSPTHKLLPFGFFDDERFAFLSNLNLLGGFTYDNASQTFHLAAAMQARFFDDAYQLSYGYRRPLGLEGASANHEISLALALNKAYSTWLRPFFSNEGDLDEDTDNEAERDESQPESVPDVPEPSGENEPEPASEPEPEPASDEEGLTEEEEEEASEEETSEGEGNEDSIQQDDDDVEVEGEEGEDGDATPQ